MTENLAKAEEPSGSFKEKLEPALQFLSSPWKIWKSGNIHLRRLVLKLAFADHVEYCPNEGARTPRIALPFKALEVVSDPKVFCGAGEEHHLIQ